MRTIADHIARTQHEQKHPSLILCQNATSCEQLKRELIFLLRDTGVRIEYLRDYEVSLKDNLSPSASVIGDRVSTLYGMINHQIDILLVTHETALLALPPTSFIQSSVIQYKVGQAISLQRMVDALQENHFTRVSEVKHHFEYAVRGNILDLYPPHSKKPIRLELDDESIETIQFFDEMTQRSIDRQRKEISLTPQYEYHLNQTSIDTNDPRRPLIAKDAIDAINQSIPPRSWQTYMPLFHQTLASIFEYLPTNTRIITEGQLDPSLREQLLQNVLLHDSVISNQHAEQLSSCAIQIKTVARQSDNGIDPRAKEWPKLLQNTQKPILFVCQSHYRLQQLESILLSHQLDYKMVQSWTEFASKNIPFGLCIGDLPFTIQGKQTMVIPEHMLSHRVTTRRKSQNHPMQNHELSVGDLLLHSDHGVGQFSGIETRTINSIDYDFIVLTYKNDDKLLFPPDQLHKLHPFNGTEQSIDPLKSKRWQKRKKKAEESIEAFAKELFSLQVERQNQQLSKMEIPFDYDQFIQGFPFTETPDQINILNDIQSDFKNGTLFERLVCGDVGFGKTEIALRSAFIAIQNGFQVALLVPTTLLATQHYNHCTERFAKWPISICLLSRSNKQAQKDKAQIADGTHQLVIGTHSLLSQSFSNLGLVIIDEEHRFGVRQKDHIRDFSQAHKLSLTATPIPRSLNMALSKLRSISIMSHPPKNRLPIVTVVEEESDEIIITALEREIHRGGQAYILYNDVSTMHLFYERMRTLCPHIHFSMIHGQMPTSTIETQMARFYSQSFQVLIASTIIESGIDIPHANTIIITRADRLGLAQLHQLRGRVGRSHHQAYAYLLTPDGTKLSDKTMMRLSAIDNNTKLGAGFHLAIADLEIRGSGNLLGEEQSGHLNAMGLSYYTQLLNRAVHHTETDEECAVDLDVMAIIPQSYIENTETRYQFYHKIASALPNELEQIEHELQDRFGTVPETTLNLMQLASAKHQAKALKIKDIKQIDHHIIVDIGAHSNINTDKVIDMISEHPKYHFAGPHHIRIDCGDQPIPNISICLNHLATCYPQPE